MISINYKCIPCHETARIAHQEQLDHSELPWPCNPTQYILMRPYFFGPGCVFQRLLNHRRVRMTRTETIDADPTILLIINWSPILCQIFCMLYHRNF